MIAVEPQSGKIKVWIGGLDFKYFQYDQVLAPAKSVPCSNRSFTVLPLNMEPV